MRFKSSWPRIRLSCFIKMWYVSLCHWPLVKTYNLLINSVFCNHGSEDKWSGLYQLVSIFMVTVRLMICTCPQWELHRALPLKSHYIARISLLDQQDVRNSEWDSVLYSLVLSCSISVSSSPSKRENSFSMVCTKGARNLHLALSYLFSWRQTLAVLHTLTLCMIFLVISSIWTF